MCGRGGRAVHRLEENSLPVCVLHGHHDFSERVTIPNAVYIKFDLLRMSIILLETYRGL
jgi:DNA repair exonuclease SbcCD nuclease subunit